MPEEEPTKNDDEKPQSLLESEKAKQLEEPGLESKLRQERSRPEKIGDAIDHGRQDENHRAEGSAFRRA